MGVVVSPVWGIGMRSIRKEERDDLQQFVGYRDVEGW